MPNFIEYLEHGVTLEMVAIQGGTFLMGSTPMELDELASDTGFLQHEMPKHEVTVSAFHIGKYQVTQAQWRAIADTPRIHRDLTPAPSCFEGPDRPIERVSWDDAVEFCDRLSLQTGKTYRLPTEAEWEYAARAGSTGEYAGTLWVMGWFDELSDDETHPVGETEPNVWGLYDMHGNVCEWVKDWYDKDYYRRSPKNDPQGPDSSDTRVLRGGSFTDYAGDCRSASRYHFAPDTCHLNFGFRLACAART